MNETELKIRVAGDPVLRKKARKVVRISADHRRLLSRMAQLMYESNGIGLAAPQVGADECLIVADIGNGLYKLVNPKIVKKEGKQSMEEGCLSVPGVSVKVNRAKKVLIEALDENGNLQSIDGCDLLACVFQHEIDHLQGKLIVDYASLLKKLAIKKKLKKLKVC
jgi:peptide deformylase